MSSQEKGPQRAGIIAAGIVGIGLAFGARSYIESRIVPPQRSVDVEPARVVNPALLLEGLPSATPEDTASSAAILVDYSERLRNEDIREGKSKEEIQILLRTHVLKEAAFLQNVNAGGVQVVPVDSQTITINNNRLDLRDQTGLTFSQVLLEAALRMLYKDASSYKDSIPSSLFSEIESMYGKVKFEGEMSIYDPFNFMWLSRGIHALEKAGKPVPSRVNFGGVIRDTDKNNNVMIIDKKTSSFGALAEYSRVQNPGAFERFKKDFAVPTITPAQSASAAEMNKAARDSFATGFSSFLNGTLARKKVLYEQETMGGGFYTDTYAFWRDFFRDTEFSFNGREKKIEEYFVGNGVAIQDDEELDYPKYWGVMLRKTAAAGINPQLPSVQTGDVVDIIGGPVVVADSNRKEAVVRWKVVVRGALQNQGWMDGEFFGGNINSPKFKG